MKRSIAQWVVRDCDWCDRCRRLDTGYAEASSTTNPNFLAIMFEAVSAFNTVGLSMGNTAAYLPSQWLLIILMFLGRVGPMARYPRS